MQQHDMPLPADINAERATLGAILLERDAIIGVAGWLTPDHFYLEKHAWIYDAMLACYRRRTPPDITTVASTLRSHALQRHAADGAEEDPPRHRLDLVGGIAYLGELSAEPVLPSHIEYYARHIYDTAALRQLVVCGGKITALGYDERRELGEIINSARSLIETVERRRECPRGTPARELLTLDLPPVRWIVPGLISEGFGYLAARPGTGKTWLLLQIAAAVASGTEVLGIETTAAPVLYLALEDSASSLQERVRMVCRNDVPEDFITYHEDSGWRPLSDGGLQQIENAIIEHQARLVIIDTLTALAPDAPRGTNPYRAEYQSLMPIRHLADRLNVAVIGSWHFSKAGASNILEMTSGTMGMPAVAVNRIGMVRDDDSSTARLKSYPKRGRELDLILSFDPDTCIWNTEGSTTAVWQSEQRRNVLLCLEESGGTADIKTLLHATDMRYNNLIQLLRAMHADGQVRRTKKRGVYTINTDDDTQEVMIS